MILIIKLGCVNSLPYSYQFTFKFKWKMLDCSELIVAPSGGIFRLEFEARMNVLRKKVKTNNVFAIFGGGGGVD